MRPSWVVCCSSFGMWDSTVCCCGIMPVIYIPSSESNGVLVIFIVAVVLAIVCLGWDAGCSEIGQILARLLASGRLVD